MPLPRWIDRFLWQRGAGVSTRTLLLGIVALPLVCLSLSLVNDVYQEYSLRKAGAMQSAQSIRTVWSAQTEQFIAQSREILEDLSRRPLVKALDPGKCDPVLKEFKQFQRAYANVLTLNADGQLVCSAKDVAKGQTSGPDRKYYFSEVQRTRAFTVGKPARGFLTGRWVSTLAYPLLGEDGAFLGVIAVSVDLEHYQPATVLPQGLNSLILGIINSDRTVIASSDPSRAQVGAHLPSDASALMLQRREGTLEATDSDGLPRLFSFASLAATDWVAFVSIDEAELVKPITHRALKRLGGFAILLVLLTVLVFSFSKYLIQPIYRMAALLSALVKGESNALIQPQGPRELRAIAEQLNGTLVAWREAENRLRLSEERYRTVFITSPDAVAITRLSDGMYLDVNEGFTQIFGWPRHEILGKTVLEVEIWKHPDARAAFIAALQRDGLVRNFETELVSKDGKVHQGLVSSHMITVDGEQCLLSVTRDVTDYRMAIERIKHLSLTDSLTGLPNREMLVVLLEQVLHSSPKHPHHHALLMVDLDEFRMVNETKGYGYGDLVLKEVAVRLRNCMAEGTMLARLGGDEFVLFLEALSHDQMTAARQVAEMAEKILFTLNQPFEIQGVGYQGACSIGIVLMADANPGYCENALAQAEVAMYQAKATGRNTYSFFDPSLQTKVSDRLTTVSGLKDAIRENQFYLLYQPQVRADGEIVGAEALIRWEDPRRGLIAPAEFIGIAEDTGLILPIGEWVLENACRQLAAWSDQPGMSSITLAVNVSARQFHQAGFTDTLLKILDKTQANPHRLKLELTESVFIDDIEAVIAKMLVLKSRGISFALDDFGTGYSSLMYLKRLPLDKLKIDQSFVRDILIDPNDAAIAQMVVALGNTLGLRVIAEGVETEAQRAYLQSLGCSHYQGYMFGKPMTARQLTDLVQSRNRA